MISRHSNSKIGSHHWAATLLSFIMRTGDALHKGGDKNSDAHLRHWGEIMQQYATELNDYIQSQPEVDEKVDIEDNFKRMVSGRLERIEQYLEDQFLSSNFQLTEQIGMQLAVQLKKSPKDINVMVALQKLDNDQKIIEPPLRENNCALWRHIINKHGNGKTLKYFQLEPPQTKVKLHELGK